MNLSYLLLVISFKAVPYIFFLRSRKLGLFFILLWAGLPVYFFFPNQEFIFSNLQANTFENIIDLLYIIILTLWLKKKNSTSVAIIGLPLFFFFLLIYSILNIREISFYSLATILNHLFFLFYMFFFSKAFTEFTVDEETLHFFLIKIILTIVVISILADIFEINSVFVQTDLRYRYRGTLGAPAFALFLLPFFVFFYLKRNISF